MMEVASIGSFTVVQSAGTEVVFIGPGGVDRGAELMAAAGRNLRRR